MHLRSILGAYRGKTIKTVRNTITHSEYHHSKTRTVFLDLKTPISKFCDLQRDYILRYIPGLLGCVSRFVYMLSI
jgi:hypothetical protein